MLKHCTTPSSSDLFARRSLRYSPSTSNSSSQQNQNESLETRISETSSTSDKDQKQQPPSNFPSNGVAKTVQKVDASTSPIFKRDASRKRRLMEKRLLRFSKAKESEPKIPIKVYAKVLSSDIEYKTLSVGSSTTARELIWILLSKYKMKHRDPKLFYLSMDINVKRTGIPLKRSLSLDDDSRPVELRSCHPWGECKFSLQSRKGGIVRIYDGVLMPESKYKCLLISEQTTAKDVIRILFHCYGMDIHERTEKYCLVEQNPSRSFERRLSRDEKPMQVQSAWPSPSNFMFVLRHSNEPGLSVGHQHQIEDMDYFSQDDFGDSNIRRNRYFFGSVNPLGVVSEKDYSGGYNNYFGNNSSGSENEDWLMKNFRNSGRSLGSSSCDSGLLLPSKMTPSPPNSLQTVESSQNNTKSSQQQQPYKPQYIKSNNSQNPYNASQSKLAAYLSKSMSLHSLLDALPAASVDTGSISGSYTALRTVVSSETRSTSKPSSGGGPLEKAVSMVNIVAASSSSTFEVSNMTKRMRRLSLSSISLDSKCSEGNRSNNFFYI